MSLQKLQNGSLLKGNLPRGCMYCREGGKLVLLVTGQCSQQCFYCPLSREKRGKDVVYANELEVEESEDVIYEARMMDALGAGITGGDPLEVAEKTCGYIELLKNSFGERFHIHLYTCVTDLATLRDVEESGLDEIRFHPPPRYWKNIEESEFALAFNKVLGGEMDLGVEIPMLPDEEKSILKLVHSLDSMGVDFLNLDELEFSETNWMRLRRRGYRTKNDISSAAESCDKLAKRILSQDTDISLHYCSSSFKDGVQLRNRILRRARNVAGDWELVTKDGTLFKGIIEAPKLEVLRDVLVERFKIPDKLVNIDYEKARVEIAPWILVEIHREIQYPSFLIEEYPTADRLEVEREPVKN